MTTVALYSTDSLDKDSNVKVSFCLFITFLGDFHHTSWGNKIETLEQMNLFSICKRQSIGVILYSGLINDRNLKMVCFMYMYRILW